MTNKSNPTSPYRCFAQRTFALAAVGGLCLNTTSCETMDIDGLANSMGQISSIPGVSMPSEFGTAMAVVKRVQAIANYQADQKQLAEARKTVNRTPAAKSSSERTYVKVKPSPSAPKTSGKNETHVVEYDPKTDTVDSKVLVVNNDLDRGDSVSINGQTGKII